MSLDKHCFICLNYYFVLLKVQKANYFVFNFLASFAMVPKAQLIVYYMKDGEIISDTVEIEFGEELHNFVSFYWTLDCSGTTMFLKNRLKWKHRPLKLDQGKILILQSQLNLVHSLAFLVLIKVLFSSRAVRILELCQSSYETHFGTVPNFRK